MLYHSQDVGIGFNWQRLILLVRLKARFARLEFIIYSGILSHV